MGSGDLPELDAERILFKRHLIPWQQWVEVWEQDQAGKGHPGEVVADIQLLPGDAGRPRDV